MRVIIIAAGSSTRFAEQTKEIPKGLLDINGRTILDRQISLFKKNKIDDIVLVTGPHHEKFNLKNVRYVIDENHLSHDVLGSLMAGRDYVKGEVLTSYSDILFDEQIFHQILNSKSDIGIAVDLNWEKGYQGRTQHPRSQADNVLIEDGKIIKIKKNITKLDTNQIIGEFIGLMKLSDNGSKNLVKHYNFLEKTQNGPFHDSTSFQRAYLTDMIQELIDCDVKITPIIVDGLWYEIDTPQDLERARKLFP